MLQLPSNISHVQVTIRNQDDVTLDPVKGQALMDYLISPDVGAFVQLNGKDGGVVVIRTTTIESVKPVKNMIEEWELKEITDEALKKKGLL